MKKRNPWHFAAALCAAVLLSLLICLQAAAFDISDVRPPVEAEKIVYGYSGAGRELIAYRFGDGENVLVAGFAIHGYEDNFNKDGGALVYTADQLMRRLKENRNLLTDYGWSVYVLPCMNPDGLMDGTTCNGPGRCTTTYIDENGKLRTGKGIDLNRSFPHNWQAFAADRNFNGSRPLSARESQALAKFVQQVKGTGTNVCLDVHGWFQQTIVSTGKDSKLYQIFNARFPNNSYANCTNSKGYFTSYTTSLGYLSCLFEFPYNIRSMDGFQSSGYCEAFNTCVLDLLKAYGTYDTHSSVCPAAGFTDVASRAWYHNAVDYVLSEGIFNGVSEHSFAPNQTMNRAMLVTTLYRMATQDKPEVLSETGEEPLEPETPVDNPELPPAEEEPAEPPEELEPEPPVFTDVAPGAWYEKAVLWAQEQGIVTGYPDGAFRPLDPLTREQLSAVFYRYCGWLMLRTDESASLESFPDCGSVSTYAQEAMQWAVGTGLVQGVAKGEQVLLLPKGTATRAQTAEIIMRFMNNMPNMAAEKGRAPEAMLWGDLGGN